MASLRTEHFRPGREVVKGVVNDVHLGTRCGIEGRKMRMADCRNGQKLLEIGGCGGRRRTLLMTIGSSGRSLPSRGTSAIFSTLKMVSPTI